MAVTGRSFPSHQVQFPRAQQLAATTSVSTTISVPVAAASASAPVPIVSDKVLPGASSAAASAPVPTLVNIPSTIIPPAASATATAGTSSFLDTFARTNVSNWDGSWVDAGFSGTGWTLSEDGARGKAVPTIANQTQARLLQDSLSDGDWYVDVQFSTAATGGLQEAGMIARFAAGASYLRCQIRQASNGTVTLRAESARSGGVSIGTFTMTGADPVANPYTIHLQLVGTALNARAWQVGTSEPVSWQITGTLNVLDPLTGSSGVRASAGASNSNFATYYFDNFQTLTTTGTATPVITLLPPASSATESIGAPIVGEIISPSAVAAAASEPSPTITMTLLAPVAAASASTPVPLSVDAGAASASVPLPVIGISIPVTVSAAASTSPSISLTLLPGAVAASASALAPLVGQVVIVPAVTAAASALAPSLSEMVSPGAAFAPGSFDTFNRLLNSNTWGTASTGESWTIWPTLLPSPSLVPSTTLTIGSGGTISVDLTKGSFAETYSTNAFLATISDSRADADVACDVSWTSTPTGDWNQIGVVLRLVDTSTYLMAGIRKNSDGTAQLRIDRVVSGSFDTIANTPISASLTSNIYTVKARVQNTTAWAKFWIVGQDEPDWMVSGALQPTDSVSGASGVFFLPSSNATDVQVASFDNFQALYPTLALADTPDPSFVLGYGPSAPASATASAPSPSLSMANIVQATASASVTAPSQSLTLTAPIAAAAASAPTPTVLGASANAQGTASASALTPTLLIAIPAPASRATASTAPIPSVALLPPVASASGTAPVPIVKITILPAPVAASASARTPSLTIAILPGPAQASGSAPAPPFLAATLIQPGAASARVSVGGRILDHQRFTGWFARPATPVILPVANGTSNAFTFSLLFNFHSAPIPSGTYVSLQAAHHHGTQTFAFDSAWAPTTYQIALPDGSTQDIAYTQSDEAQFGVLTQGGVSYLTAGFSEQRPTLSNISVVRNQNYRMDVRANCESGIWSIDWMVNLVSQTQVTTAHRLEGFVFDRTPSHWRQAVLAPDAFPTYNDFELIGYTSNPALTPYPLD